MQLAHTHVFMFPGWCDNGEGGREGGREESRKGGRGEERRGEERRGEATDRVLNVLVVGSDLLLPELGKVDGGAEDLDQALVLGLGNVLEGKVVDPAAIHETHAADRGCGASQRIRASVRGDAGCSQRGEGRETQRVRLAWLARRARGERGWGANMERLKASCPTENSWSSG